MTPKGLLTTNACSLYHRVTLVQAEHLNTSQKVSSPSNRDCNFQVICYIINSIMLLGVEFNNAHLDTSFASIDPQIMKLHPILKGSPLESENCT